MQLQKLSCFPLSSVALCLCLSLSAQIAHELQPTIVFFSSVLFLQQSFISLAVMAWRKLASFHGSRRFLVPVIMVFSSVFSSLLLISPVFAILSDDHHVQVVASSYSDHGSNVLALERSSSFGDLDQYSVEFVLGRRRRLSAESLQTAADVQHAPEEVSLECISLGMLYFLQLPTSIFLGRRFSQLNPLVGASLLSFFWPLMFSYFCIRSWRIHLYAWLANCKR